MQENGLKAAGTSSTSHLWEVSSVKLDSKCVKQGGCFMMDALFTTIREGDATKLAQVLKEKECAQAINTKNTNGEYAIHFAARLLGQGGVDCINTLVKHGAKVQYYQQLLFMHHYLH